MRRVALLACLSTAAACCIDVAPDDACVVERLGERPICRGVVNEDVVCPWGNGEPELPPLVERRGTCDGITHSGADCTDLGFTLDCGGYRVRRGDPC